MQQTYTWANRLFLGNCLAYIRHSTDPGRRVDSVFSIKNNLVNTGGFVAPVVPDIHFSFFLQPLKKWKLAV